MEPRRILIVEDELLTAHILRAHLLNKGYIVCELATNYDEAIKLVDSEDPHLALVDITLVGSQDGIVTALALLRRKEMPIIYLTGNSEEATFVRAKITNPSAFLYKPYRENELINQVELAILNFYPTTPRSHSSIDDFLFIPFEKSHVRLDKNEIIYIDAQRGYSDIFLTLDGAKRILGEDKKNLPMVVTYNLGYLSNYLPMPFYRISNSTLINLAHIQRIDFEYIYFDRYKIRVPGGKYKKLLEQLNTIKNRQ